jgi:uncharacterized Tic20 family protein
MFVGNADGEETLLIDTQNRNSLQLTLSGLVMVTVSMVVVGAILLSDGRLELK